VQEPNSGGYKSTPHRGYKPFEKKGVKEREKEPRGILHGKGDKGFRTADLKTGGCYSNGRGLAQYKSGKRRFPFGGFVALSQGLTEEVAKKDRNLSIVHGRNKEMHNLSGGGGGGGGAGGRI